MRKILPLMLLLLIGVALAAEQISSENFSEPIIEPKLKDFYLPGDEISFNLTIQPKTDDDAKKIDGRYYEFNTSLENPEITVKVVYGGTGAIRYFTGKEYVKADVKDWEDGVAEIKVEVSGKVPTVEERIAEIFALYIDIQDAEENAVEPVKIKVVNVQAFESFINELKNKLDSLKAKANELEEKGVYVVLAKEKLKEAEESLSDGESNFKNEEYLQANESLGKAESYILEAEKLLIKSELEFKKSRLEEELGDFLYKMDEADVIITRLKSEGVSTLNYEIKLEDFKRIYSELNQKLTAAGDYIDKELFDDAERVLEDVEKTLDEKLSELDMMITEMQGLMEEEETPTPTPTPTPEKEEGAFKPISEAFSKISEYISENRERILLYLGGGVAVAIIAVVGYKGLKGYMRKRRFDELK